MPELVAFPWNPLTSSAPRRFASLTASARARKSRRSFCVTGTQWTAASVKLSVEETEALWRAWMLAGLAGDASAYRRLLDALTPRLRAFVARHLIADYAADIEDIVQEILIAVHSQRVRYDGSKPLAPWLFAISRYKLIDHCRRAGRRGVSVSVDAVEDLLIAAESEPALDTSELGSLLEQLPQKQRTAIDLVKLQDLSVRDAAKRSGMSEAAIRVNVHRGIKALAALVGRRAQS